MENASKALIIAGAILLAIVIISLGLIVVNNTRNVTDNTNLSEQEIQAFNAKFTPYQGTEVLGTKVKALAQIALASNQQNSNKVTVSGGVVKDEWKDTSSVKNGSKYKVTLKYNGAVVNEINISE